MRPLTLPARAVAVAAVAAAAVGCTGGSATQTRAPSDPCANVTTQLLAQTQRYIDGYGVDAQPSVGASASPSPTRPATPTPSATSSPLTEQDYGLAISTARNELAAAKCDQATFQQQLAAGLRATHAKGAIAAAVLAQLRVSLTGALPPKPVTRTIGPADDVADALAAMPDGSTLVMRAGTYRLPDILVILRSVSVRGAGPGRTILTGAAAEATLLLMTAKPVTLEQLAVRHVGKAAGSVVVTGPTAALSLRDVSVSGGRADSSGGGGIGVLLTGSSAGRPSPTVTFTAVGSTFSDNDAAGVAAGGVHRIALSTSTFANDRQCGVCFLGDSEGTVRDSTFRRNAVGVVTSSSGAPLVRHNTIAEGDVGIQAAGDARPVLLDNVIRAMTRAAMVFIGNASGRVDGNNCSGDPSGIAVARSAYPDVRTNACRVTLGQ